MPSRFDLKGMRLLPLSAAGRSYKERASGSRPVGGLVKRIIDITIGIVALIAFVPVFVLVRNYHCSLGWAARLVWARTLGFDRAKFRCFKIRTMVTNGDELFRRHLRDHPDVLQEWVETQKIKI